MYKAPGPSRSHLYDELLIPELSVPSSTVAVLEKSALTPTVVVGSPVIEGSEVSQIKVNKADRLFPAESDTVIVAVYSPSLVVRSNAETSQISIAYCSFIWGQINGA